MSLLTYTPLGKAWTESCYPKVWCYKGQGKRAVQVITALTFSNPLDSVHLSFSHFQGLCRSYLCMDNFNSSRRGNIVVNWIACKMFPHLFTGAPSFHSWKLFLKNSERFFNLYFADTIYFKNLHVYANRVKNNQGNQVFLYHEHLETAEITISHRTLGHKCCYVLLRVEEMNL